MHREADDVWRIDFQLGWDADPEVEKQPERVDAAHPPLLDQQGLAHIGFELEWVSVYTFQCRRMDALPPRPAALRRRRGAPGLALRRARRQLRHPGHRQPGLEAGRSWSTARRPRRCSTATPRERERRGRREPAATRRASTDFMTPKSKVARTLRDAVLSLAGEVPGVRALVNSGRLSVPSTLADSPLNTPDAERLRRLDAARRADGRRAGRRPSAATGCCRTWAHDGGFTLLLFGTPDARATPGGVAGRCRCRAAGRARAPPAWPALRDAKAWSRSAATPGPAPACWCAPTSMWPRAGAASTPRRVRAALRARQRAQANEAPRCRPNT